MPYEQSVRDPHDFAALLTNPSALITPTHVKLAALTIGGVLVAFPHLESSPLPGLYALVVAGAHRGGRRVAGRVLGADRGVVAARGAA